MMPTDSLSTTFSALADPTRRAILARLAAGDASVTELAQPFEISQPAISKHLKVLERAGLISRTRDAQRRPRRLEPQPLAEATKWLENYRLFWERRFHHLDALLDEMQRFQNTPNRSRPRLAHATTHRAAAQRAPRKSLRTQKRKGTLQ